MFLEPVSKLMTASNGNGGVVTGALMEDLLLEDNRHEKLNRDGARQQVCHSFSPTSMICTRFSPCLLVQKTWSRIPKVSCKVHHILYLNGDKNIRHIR
jgi:hypothetical protein